jgi:uncharacterized protein
MKIGNGVAQLTNKRKIWIDLDNSPHVPFFNPIIRELEATGNTVFLTTRKAFQVCELADKVGLRYQRIGRHHGKNKALKAFGLVWRALQMMPVIMRERPALAVSHGSRAQLIACGLLGIPSIIMFDYEYVKGIAGIHPKWVFVPELIPDGALVHIGRHTKVVKYPGIKEDVYVPEFIPDSHVMADLCVDEKKTIVTIRPPATEAHYFVAASEKLFEDAVDFIGNNRKEVVMIMVPRNSKQDAVIRKRWESWCTNGTIIIPEKVVDGLSLMWFSDLVISGGGTMNREAAALGIPVYSIFRGRIGAVDRYLSQTGRLVILEKSEDLSEKVVFHKRNNANGQVSFQKNKSTLLYVVGNIVRILSECE